MRDHALNATRDARGAEPREGDRMAEQMLRAARRQNALDRVAELLAEWGSTATDTRAVAILDAVTSAGYRLPEALDDAAPYRGPGSTPQARDRAHVEFLVAQGWTHDAAVAYVDDRRRALVAAGGGR